MEVLEKSLKIYRAQNGSIPYVEWFSKLRDTRAKQKILSRLARVRSGNLGNVRSVGEGVNELKIDYGPGYRIYFGQIGREIVVLLCGGDKGTQYEDIKKAKSFWEDYKTQKSHSEY